VLFSMMTLVKSEKEAPFSRNNMPTPSDPDTDQRVLILSPGDNVMVAVAEIEAGESLAVEGRRLKTAVRLPMGHKLARRNIRAGEKILKYGTSIGSATRDIAAGEHVHTHNMKSDYLPTYAREGEKSYVGQH